ncbi:calcium-activated potassium channel subunit alpha-1 [Elysia marginata]|uniref:Calcium-activated potassium channel subunit alpha-1 n=1 Tax=Elysia marginata TaxID=1093978 RepID=A0AAV4JLH2_9GAST|nr:calcium-activated potassium channel subunit alpha-1 [Elysia marginata]
MAGVVTYDRWGAGANKAFGSDFAVDGRKWTQAFCNADSDVGALSNKQVLDEPGCVCACVVSRKQTLTYRRNHSSDLVVLDCCEHAGF